MHQLATRCADHRPRTASSSCPDGAYVSSIEDLRLAQPMPSDWPSLIAAKSARQSMRLQAWILRHANIRLAHKALQSDQSVLLSNRQVRADRDQDSKHPELFERDGSKVRLLRPSTRKLRQEMTVRRLAALVAIVAGNR